MGIMTRFDVGENIRRLRKDRALTQEDLAARIGEDTSIATISKLEKGQMKLTHDWIVALADALGVSQHDIIAEPDFSMRVVPVLGLIQAGAWSEAIAEPSGWIPVFGDVGGVNVFALQPVGDSMDKLVREGGYIVVDPDQRDLHDGSHFAVMNAHGETTFKRYLASPPQLVPVSYNGEHQPIPLGREPFVVIGRVTWAGGAP